MITPLIHRVLTREDLARLVAEIGRVDQAGARAAEQAVQAGEVDVVLDSAAALEAVRGRGGAPAAVPLTILWYVPVRAALRARGVSDVDLADYAATVPVVFATWRAVRTVARGETGIGVWWRYVASLPDGTVAQAEGAADVAALALWWAGCFPEWVTRRAAGRGMVRADGWCVRLALALKLHQYQVKSVVAGIFGKVFARLTPPRVSRLPLGGLRLSVRIGEFSVDIRQEHGHGRRMVVHHGLFVRAVMNPQHAYLSILELHFVVVGINLDGILGQSGGDR